LICLAGLAASQKLPAALVTHVNAEALSNAIFQPVNNTNYSALPLRFQGRIRTLADGIFYPGGMAIAGLMLLWAQDRDATTEATYIALASALAFLLINVGVAVLFRPTLVRNLRSGIDHFAEVAERLRPPRLSASQVRRFIHSSNAATRALGFSALQRFDLAPLFDDLHTIASQADRETRRHLVDLLQGMPEPAAQQLAHRLLNDSEVGAQLVGLQYWLGLREPGERDRLGTLAQAPETGVAALARLVLARDDPAAIGELCSELRAHGPLDADTCAALIDAIATAGRAELTPFLIGLIESARLEHIQEALITLGRIASRQDAAAAECARRFVTHHDHRVRAAAVGALGAFEPRPPITAPLERGLEDPHPTVRRRATEALARHGDAAVEIAAARLTDADDRVVKAAVHALGKIGSRRARGALEAFVEQRCALGVRHLSWLGQLPDPRHDPRWRALRVILEETNRRTLDLALEALAALGQERIVQHVRRMLESEDPRRRADAVETLLALRHRHLVMALLPLLEALGRPDEPPGWPSARAVTADLSGAAARDPDPWVRAAARVATGASAPSTYRGDDATPSTNEQMSHRTASVREVVEVSETQVERSLFLKSIPLFRNLPLNTLMAVGEVLSHRRCAPGEEILRAGRSSAELFILERGVVVFKDGSTEVERRTAPALFAEESLVEDLAWSRAVVAVEPCRLLTMHRTVFQDLAHDYPEIVVELSRLLARRREDRSPVAEKPSIAVLPFENRSNDREQDYFADGIAEDIITALSRNRWFLVIARNSSFAFKDSAQDRNAVARSLGVRYLLQGSVRRVGQRVRISAQLVDAIAGYQVWADRYDRELGDILAVQDEITTSIVSAVAPEFLSAETLRAKRKDELNLNAWECVLRARWHHARCSQRDLVETHALLEKALALDPLNGGACCLSAFTHLAEIQFGWTRSPRAALTAAAQAARTAVSLDARDAEAHAALGLVDLMSRRYDDAIGRFEHAVSLNPNLALAQAGLGQAHALTGDYGPAVVQIEKAIRLSPEDPFMVYWFGHLGLAAFAAGRYEEASEWGTKAVSHNPASPAGHRLLAASLAQLGRIGEARAALRELLQRMPGMTGEDVRRQVPFKKEEVMELYIEGLRKAGLPE
ncbi:MAG TPA: HEAT repeat domain-containing protein, partial [Geminicoccaceae bacterium]|nr:HEAT repeat domain-containing protein [Geminicoccaceae bacterium]